MTTATLRVAETILAQLGGHRFRVMTGAKNLVGSPNSLSFKIGRNASQANGVRIILDPDDTYTVEFVRVTRRDGHTRTVLHTDSMVYFDQLQPVFSAFTGMATHL